MEKQMVTPAAGSAAAITEKTCIECGRTLSVDNFRRNVKSPDGYIKLCNDCYAKHRREAASGRAESVPPVPSVPQGTGTEQNAVKVASTQEEKQQVVYPLKAIADKYLIAELSRRGWKGSLTKTAILSGGLDEDNAE